MDTDIIGGPHGSFGDMDVVDAGERNVVIVTAAVVADDHPVLDGKGPAAFSDIEFALGVEESLNWNDLCPPHSLQPGRSHWPTPPSSLRTHTCDACRWV